MDNEENKTPRREIKTWQIIAVAATVLLLVGMLLGNKSGSISTQSNNTPKASAVFTGDIAFTTLINPATINVKFSITNSGTAAGKPDCKVKVQDVSGTYSGYDYPVVNTPIQPGESLKGNMNLTIRNQGAAFVTEGSVTCS